MPRDAHRILDLGTGDGRLLALLGIDRKEMVGVGLDFSELMLEAARKRFADDERIEVVKHDLAEPLPTLGRFDAVVSSMAIHHLEHERKRSLYGEMFDLLERGGDFAASEARGTMHERYKGRREELRGLPLRRAVGAPAAVRPVRHRRANACLRLCAGRASTLPRPSWAADWAAERPIFDRKDIRPEGGQRLAEATLYPILVWMTLDLPMEFQLAGHPLSVATKPGRGPGGIAARLLWQRPDIRRFRLRAPDSARRLCGLVAAAADHSPDRRAREDADLALALPPLPHGTPRYFTSSCAPARSSIRVGTGTCSDGPARLCLPCN